MYNTGSQSRGFRNGYVAKVVGNAGIADMQASYTTTASQPIAETSSDLRTIIVAENAAQQAPPRPAPPPRWNLFERAAYERETKALANNERGSI